MMKFVAFHDAKGALSALVSQPANMPRGAVASTTGALVTEVDVPEVTIDPADANGLLKLLDLVQHYRIEVKTQAKLTRNPPQGS